MKFTKLITAGVIAVAAFATIAEAGSIGRSGGGGYSGGSRSSSSSFSRPSSSFSAPSKPAVAPSHPGGIGGTTASVGVRKPEVTNTVRNDVAATKPGAVSGSTSSSYTPHYTPTPSFGYNTPPAPSVTNGSTFMSSLGGSLVGSMLGNAISAPRSSGGTTVINNGGGGSGSAPGAVSTGPSVGDAQFNPGGVSTYKKEYTVWSFIGDLIGFVFVVAILLGIAWLFYKGFQLVRNYVQKERGVSTQPFNPTQRFWEIQKAFAAADSEKLVTFLGPDVVDELTADLQPSNLTLSRVSSEVRLQNATEFSIWYNFQDDGTPVNQVWHYERFGKEWKLNGIENV